MAAILNVWIAKPGEPCYVDDHPWTVHVFDSSGNPYRWATRDYANLPAPQGHWADAIPPGCYVVQASGKDAGGNPVETDHAIVEVGCEGTECVRLYVPAPKGTGSRCAIKITDVHGLGSPDPEKIEVTGTATGCSHVVVTVECRTQQTGHAVATVSGGVWSATVVTKDLRCKCGGPVTVTAACKEDPKCMDVYKSESLRCAKG